MCIIRDLVNGGSSDSYLINILLCSNAKHGSFCAIAFVYFVVYLSSVYVKRIYHRSFEKFNVLCPMVGGKIVIAD